MLLRVRSLRRRFFAAFDALHARYAGAGGHETTADEVLASFRSLEEDAGRFWHLTIQNDFCALKYHAWLGRLLERWTSGVGPEVAGALVSGPESVESVAPVRSLLALTDAVRADPANQALFARDDDAAIWAALDGDPRWSRLREAFRAHLRAFGDRSVAELKLDTVTFAEAPERLVGLVKHSLRAGTTGADLERQRRAVVLRAAQLRRDAVRGLLRRPVFGFVLDRARDAIRCREDMRLARTRLFGLVRRLFRRLGRLLHEQGVLASPADVHYLTVEELFDLAQGTGATRDVGALVALRRREYDGHAAAAAPSRFETSGVPSRAAPPARAPAATTERTSLRGTGCAGGQAAGPAAVVRDPEHATGGADRVLVAASTDPGWVFLMMSSAGIVVERGSVLSHTAIIGRELGIPTVVGVDGATGLIPDGAPVTIDGGTGDVRWA
jgi:pyruvate,water dikinase